MKTLTAILTTLGLFVAGLSASAADSSTTTAGDEAVIAAQLPSYPLDICPISSEGLGEMGDPINVVVEGRLVRVCCKGCVKGVNKNPKSAFALIDAAVIEAQKPSYPLETCVISGEKLGSMGDPIDLVHGTRLVRLCCKGCVKGFQKDPDAGLEKVNTALIAAQKKTYPLDTCLVSGEGLTEMGEPIDMLYGTRLVRLCCKGCVKGMKKDPKGMIAKLDAAAKKTKKS